MPIDLINLNKTSLMEPKSTFRYVEVLFLAITVYYELTSGFLSSHVWLGQIIIFRLPSLATIFGSVEATLRTQPCS